MRNWKHIWCCCFAQFITQLAIHVTTCRWRLFSIKFLSTRGKVKLTFRIVLVFAVLYLCIFLFKLRIRVKVSNILLFSKRNAIYFSTICCQSQSNCFRNQKQLDVQYIFVNVFDLFSIDACIIVQFEIFNYSNPLNQSSNTTASIKSQIIVSNNF